MTRSSLALPLAIAATATAICLSVLAGWQRGGPLAERVVFVAVGVVLVIGAHLLPALVRSSPLVVRGAAGVLWLACMVTACYGHLTFFLLAQRHAGELRAASVDALVRAPAGRSLAAIMTDRATVAAQSATANARRCPRDCSTLEARRVTLAAKLDALDAEAEDIRRSRAADDRVMAQREGLAADPVTTRLAALVGTTVSRIDLLSGLAFAAVLEVLACLLWAVTLRSPPVVTDAIPVEASVVPSSKLNPVRRNPKSKRPVVAGGPITPLPVKRSADAAMAQLAEDVAAGRVRPTVAEIRSHLGCSQARAAAARRQLLSQDLTT